MADNEKFCAYDEDRLCNDSCIAFMEERVGLGHEIIWDLSKPIPEYIWVASLRIIGSFCKRGEFWLIKKSVEKKEGD